MIYTCTYWDIYIYIFIFIFHLHHAFTKHIYKYNVLLRPAAPLDVSSAWSLDKAERLRSLAWDSVWCSSQAALIFQWQFMNDIRIFTGLFTRVISAESWAGFHMWSWLLRITCSWLRFLGLWAEHASKQANKIMIESVEVHQHSALPLN